MPNITISACPNLPPIRSGLPITHTRQHRVSCDVRYYIACLELAQSLWLSKKPAQAILQLDKAMMAIIPANHGILNTHPIPYSAIAWIMKNSPLGHFIGNPVRHFQHLASRMNLKQPQPELRIARAWACLHIAESILNHKEYPRDQEQITAAPLEIPNIDTSRETLLTLSPHKLEVDWFNNSIHSRQQNCSSTPPKSIGNHHSS